MKNLRKTLKIVLLMATGVNLALFSFGLSLGSSDMYLLAIASAVFCFTGYVSLSLDESDER